MENITSISKEELLKLLRESNITPDEIADTLNSKRQVELEDKLKQLEEESKNNLSEIDKLKKRNSIIKSEMKKVNAALKKMGVQTTVVTRRNYNPPLTVLAEKYGQDLHTLRSWVRSGKLKFDADKKIDMECFFELIGYVPTVQDLFTEETAEQQKQDINEAFLNI
jgi:flagella basal body P-ring formation protein FlgA